MAKMSLLAKLKAMATLNLVFTSLTSAKDQEGKLIAILKLEDPIFEIRGSQELEYEGLKRPLIAYDVQEVKVHESNMDEGFEVDEDGTVTYTGDGLVLDVAKSTKQVWLVKETFASSGNKLRTNLRQERIGKILGLDAVNPAANAANPPAAAPTPAPTVVNPAKEKAGA